MLQESRINVLGVTVPQIYMKVKGNWTGGHQENLRLRATNLNHGPDSSIWYNVGGKTNIDRFRELAKRDFDIDIFYSEGLWFCDPDYCLANGIPVRVANQQAGDMVVLAPGTVHWVRSLGMTTQTAWNFADFSVTQLQEMIARYKINKETNFKTIIPFYTLFADLAAKNKFRTNEMKEIVR